MGQLTGGARSQELDRETNLQRIVPTTATNRQGLLLNRVTKKQLERDLENNEQTKLYQQTVQNTITITNTFVN